jgi:photosystem II stability/assembly factor-like uncharacterized protein
MHSGRTFLYIFLLFLCSIFSVQAEDNRRTQASFERLGPYGGDVRSLLMDARQPRIVYLGTSSGKIYKSKDGGVSWSALNPGIGRNGFVVDTLIQHPEEQDHIYAGAWDLHSDGGGLFESRDAGLSWTRIELPRASAAVRGIALCRSEPSRMMVGTLAGAYVSSDGGIQWKRVGGEDLQKARSVAIDPEDCNTLYVGTWRLAYKSTDFGETWTRMRKGMALDSDVFSISISKRDPRIVYSSACSGVYRSTNGAQSWSRLKLLPSRLNIRAQIVTIDPMDDRRVYGGTTEGLFVSDTEGRAWRRLTSGDLTINAVQIDPEDNRNILIGTEYRGILKSEDAGRTWKESNEGFVHKSISWILPDTEGKGRLVAGVLSGGGGLYSFDENSSRWTSSQIEPGLRVLSFLILPEAQGRLAGTTQGVYWQPQPSKPWTKLEGSIARCTVYSLALDHAHPVVYAGTDQGIYRTTVSAMRFRMPPGSRLSPKAWCLCAPEINPGIVYAGTSLGLLRSWDRGTTWNVISVHGLPDRVLIGALAVSPSNKDHLFAGTSVGLFESENGGVHWRRSRDRRLSVEISSLLFLDKSGRRLLAADKTAGGVFYSQDGGESWDKLFSPQFESPIRCVAKLPGGLSQVYIGTQSDGIYRLHLP